MSIKSDQLISTIPTPTTSGRSNTFVGYVPDSTIFFTSWNEADQWAREYTPGVDPVNVRVTYYRAISGGITVLSTDLDWPRGQQARFGDTVGSVTKILELVVAKKLGVNKRKGKRKT